MHLPRLSVVLLAPVVAILACSGSSPAPIVSAVGDVDLDASAVAPPDAPSAPSPLERSLDELLAPHVDADGANGMAVGMAVGVIAGQERIVRGYGATERRGARLPDGRTLFKIGSITKVFTGLLFAEAIERGEVGLEDPIDRHLPAGVRGPSFEGRPITLLDLATHSSGLPRLAPNASTPTAADPAPVYTVDKLYAFLDRYSLPYAPGTKYLYSNIGNALLAHLVVNRAQGRAFDRAIADDITGPLAMADTLVTLDAARDARKAVGYDGTSVTPATNVEILEGIGGLWSTAEDMLLFVDANLGRRGPALQAALQNVQTPRRPAEEGSQIGLALGVRAIDGHDVHLKTGEISGYTALFAFDRDRGLGAVVLTNTAGFDFKPLLSPLFAVLAAGR